MVSSFCVSNCAFAEWCATAGAPVSSNATATEAMTMFLTMARSPLLLFHDVRHRKHDVRIRTEIGDGEIGERLAVESPGDSAREDHPDTGLPVVAVIREGRPVDVAVRLRGDRHRQAYRLVRRVGAQLAVLIFDRHG